MRESVYTTPPGCRSDRWAPPGGTSPTERPYPATLADLVGYLEMHPGRDSSSWKVCTAGDDVVPVDPHRRFHKATGFEIAELYGMTEVLSCMTNLPFGRKKLGSVGLPAVRTACRVVDCDDRDLLPDTLGELLVNSPAMLVGYWDDPTATADALRGGWMHTGDLAKVDADGYYWFVGRKKEIIIHGGSNISPLELEEVLDAHPTVHLSCVVGKPDTHWGRTVAVSLRRMNGSSTIDRWHRDRRVWVRRQGDEDQNAFLEQLAVAGVGQLFAAGHDDRGPFLQGLLPDGGVDLLPVEVVPGEVAESCFLDRLVDDAYLGDRLIHRLSIDRRGNIHDVRFLHGHSDRRFDVAADPLHVPQ